MAISVDAAQEETRKGLEIKEKKEKEEKNSSEIQNTALIPQYAQITLPVKYESIFFMKDGTKIKFLSEKDLEKFENRYINDFYRNGLSELSLNKHTSAYENFKKAGEKGHLKAIVDAAICLENGLGIVENKEAAAEIYQIAAENGEPRAQCALASMLLSGKVVPQSEEGAIFWLQKAVMDHNYPTAKYLLAKCFDENMDVDMSEEQSLRYYQEAQKGGEPRASYKIALRYLFEGHFDYALLLFQKIVHKNFLNTSVDKIGHGLRRDDFTEIVKNEVSASEQIAICQQSILMKENTKSSSGLFAFHHNYRVAKKAKVFQAQQKMVLANPNMKLANAHQLFRDLMNVLNQGNINPDVVMKTFSSHKQDFLVSGFAEEWNFPNKDVVLWHKSVGDVVIDASNFNCRNLYVLVQQGELIMKENAAVKVEGGDFICIMGGEGNKGQVKIENCLLDVSSVIAVFTHQPISISTQLAGALKAKLGLFFGNSVQLGTQSMINECLDRAEPEDIIQYIQGAKEVITKTLLQLQPVQVAATSSAKNSEQEIKEKKEEFIVDPNLNLPTQKEVQQRAINLGIPLKFGIPEAVQIPGAITPGFNKLKQNESQVDSISVTQEIEEANTGSKTLNLH